MKRTPTLILLMVAIIGIFSFSESINSPKFLSLESQGWVHLKFDKTFKQEKWNEIPLTIINNEIIFSRSKNTTSNIDERKNNTSLFYLQISDLQKTKRGKDSVQIKSFKKDYLKGYQVKDIIKKDLDDNLYFTAKNFGKYELFKADLSDTLRIRENIERVQFKNGERPEVFQPTLNKNGERLVFVKKNKGSGYDLYESIWGKNGFSIPEPLDSINTEFDETRPNFIFTKSGKEELVFTSNAPKKNGKRYSQVKIYLREAQKAIPINQIKPKNQQPAFYSTLTHFDPISGVVYEIAGVEHEGSVEMFYRISEKKTEQIRYFAFTIAVDKFNNPKLNLKNALASQNILAESLEQCNFTDAQSTHLKNPTKDEIETQFNYYRDTLQQKDYLLIYINTHGFKDNKDVWYFAPANGKENDLRNTCVSADFLGAFLRDVSSTQVMIIIDACYAMEIDYKTKGSNKDGRSRILLSIHDNEKKGKLGDKTCFADWIANFLNNQKDYRVTSEKLYQSLKGIGTNCYKSGGIEVIYTSKSGGLNDFIFRRKVKS